MAALARELSAAGTAVSRAIASAGRGDARKYLSVAAGQVEGGANLLLTLILSAQPLAASSTDVEFAATLAAAAGPAILDCGSRGAACAEADPLQLGEHTEALRNLLQALVALGRWCGEALARLRSSAVCPEAMIACFQRLFEKDWDFEAGEAAPWQ